MEQTEILALIHRDEKTERPAYKTEILTQIIASKMDPDEAKAAIKELIDEDLITESQDKTLHLTEEGLERLAE